MERRNNRRVLRRPPWAYQRRRTHSLALLAKDQPLPLHRYRPPRPDSLAAGLSSAASASHCGLSSRRRSPRRSATPMKSPGVPGRCFILETGFLSGLPSPAPPCGSCKRCGVRCAAGADRLTKIQDAGRCDPPYPASLLPRPRTRCPGAEGPPIGGPPFDGGHERVPKVIETSFPTSKSSQIGPKLCPASTWFIVV